MKLTKIESYEIQAFAFRVMTGYMAPGKDSSPLADALLAALATPSEESKCKTY